MGLGAAASALFGANDVQAASVPIGFGRSVTDFGIEPNATRDQSAAFQKVVEALASQGQPIIVPAGRYVASRIRLPSNANLIGVPGLTIFSPAAAGSPVFEGANIQNVALRGLSFIGLALIAVECRDVTISDCRIISSGADGFICGGTGLFIANNRAAGCARSAIWVDGDGIITTNLVSGAGQFGLRIGSAKHLGTLTVINNRVEGPSVGIAVSNATGGYAFIAMNMISGAANGGIRALNGDDLIGKDLTRGGSEAFRNLAIAANVSV
jgi:hypothetical protein